MDDELLDLVMEWEGALLRGEEISPLQLAGNDSCLAGRIDNEIRKLCRVPDVIAGGDYSSDASLLKASLGPKRREYERHSAANSSCLGTKQFADYEVLSEIGRGGMGVVYRARHVRLNRVVALKTVLSGKHAHAADIARFHTEAQAAAQLDHPSIVPIYEVGEHQGCHFFSMALVTGSSLAERLNAGPLPPRQAAELMKQIAEAIAYAHGKGVIHRDVKPANVLLDAQGAPKITDFGLAKRLDTDSDLTRTGEVIGTPGYLSPEQALGKKDSSGPLADVYSLGATLYCLLTGRPPFQAATVIDTLMQVLDVEPAPLRQLNAKVPKDLETICLKCLHKEPARRYASADELAADLGRYLAGQAIVARPSGRIEKTLRWGQRNPIVASLASVALVLLVTAVVALAAAREYRHQVGQSEIVRTYAEQAYRAKSRQLAVADFTSELLQIAEREQRRPVGWTWQQRQSLKNIADRFEILADITGPNGKQLVDLVELRSRAVAAMSAIDLRRIAAHDVDFPVRRMAIEPQQQQQVVLGATFTSVAEFGAIHMERWDLDSGRNTVFRIPSALDMMAKRANGVMRVAYSPQGKTLAIGLRYGQAVLCDPESLEVITRLETAGGEVVGLEFPDEQRLWTVTDKGHIQLWDLQSKAALHTSTIESSRTHEAALVGSLLYLATSDGGKVFDTQALRARENANLMQAGVALETLPEYSAVYTSQPEGFRVWSADDALNDRSLRDPAAEMAHDGEVHSIAIDTRRRVLASSDAASTKLWDLATGSLVQRIPHSTLHESPVVFREVAEPEQNGGSSAREGNSMRASMHRTEMILIANEQLNRYELTTNCLSTIAYEPCTLKGFDVAGDGSVIVTTGYASQANGIAFGQLAFVQCHTAQGLRWRKRHNPGLMWAVALVPSNSACLVADGSYGHIRLLDLETGEIRTQAVGFKEPGRMVVTSQKEVWCQLHEPGRPSGICRLNPETLQVLESMPGARLVYSGDNVLAYTFLDELAQFRSLSPGDQNEVKFSTLRRFGPVACAVDAPVLILGEQSGTLSAWDMRSTGDDDSQPQGSDALEHASAVTALSDFPDSNGGLLFSGDAEGNLCMWKLQHTSLQLLWRLKVSQRPIVQIQFRPQANRVYFLAKGDSAVRSLDLAALQAEFTQLGLAW